jgi:RimJ/RimL family protein N-acetyltransferase
VNDTIRLRDVTDADLAVFFEFQLDPEANRMAAFTAEDPTDRDAFEAHWKRIRADESITFRTIIVDNAVVGHIASFLRDREPEITYWIGREHWGKGIATKALAAFLAENGSRPLHARVAKDNAGSIRVLEKNGFTIIGEERGFANARGEEIDEIIFRLE